MLEKRRIYAEEVGEWSKVLKTIEKIMIDTNAEIFHDISRRLRILTKTPIDIYFEEGVPVKHMVLEGDNWIRIYRFRKRLLYKIGIGPNYVHYWFGSKPREGKNTYNTGDVFIKEPYWVLGFANLLDDNIVDALKRSGTIIRPENRWELAQVILAIINTCKNIPNKKVREVEREVWKALSSRHKKDVEFYVEEPYSNDPVYERDIIIIKPIQANKIKFDIIRPDMTYYDKESTRYHNKLLSREKRRKKLMSALERTWIVEDIIMQETTEIAKKRVENIIRTLLGLTELIMENKHLIP